MVCKDCEHFEKSRLYSFGCCKVKNYERHEADDVCCDVQSIGVGQDILIANYDCSSSDVPTLCIARNERNRINVLKMIQGDEAFGVYHYLTGGADLKSAREIPMQHHHTIVGKCSGGEKVRASICPKCLGYIMTVAEEFPRFCTWCGQAIDWND